MAADQATSDEDQESGEEPIGGRSRRSHACYDRDQRWDGRRRGGVIGMILIANVNWTCLRGAAASPITKEKLLGGGPTA